MAPQILLIIRQLSLCERRSGSAGQTEQQVQERASQALES